MRRIAILVLTLAAFGGMAATGPASTTYAPPYAAGPSGGDRYNVSEAGDDGRLVLLRAYPVPSSIGCAARGGFVNYELTHTADAPLGTVTVGYEEAAVDPYTFVSVNVIDDDGRFLGSRKAHGPLTGAGSLEVDVHWPDDDEAAHRIRDVRIQVGLEVTSACPSVDGGTLRVPAVTVTDR